MTHGTFAHPIRRPRGAPHAAARRRRPRRGLLEVVGRRQGRARRLRAHAAALRRAARGNRCVGVRHRGLQRQRARESRSGQAEPPLLVRSLRADWLRPGEPRTVPFLPSTLKARLEHKRQAWGSATIARSPGAAPIPSAIGVVRAVLYTVAEQGGDVTTWSV